MNKNVALSSEAHAMDAAATKNAAASYVLRLYVAGTTPRSIRAISNVRRICDEHLGGRHDFEVVDISQHPVVAATEQIFAAPTLIKELPLPARRFVGDMSELDRLLIGLDVRPRAERRPTGSVGHPT